MLIPLIKKANPWHLVGISVAVSEIFTAIIVSVMSILFRGRIASDYLITGAAAAFFVSLVVASILVYLIKQLSLAETARQESEERMMSLIEATPDVVLFKDGEGRWLIANHEARKLFNLTDKDYQGKTDLELGEMIPFYKDVLAYCRNTDENTWLRKNLSRAEETIPQHNNKEPLIFDIIKVPLFEQDGSRKGLVIIGRDMTEHKNMEDKLNMASEVFENTTEGIVITDVNANILSINPAFTAVTGYTAEEAIGKDMSLLKSGKHDAEFYKGMWMVLSTTGSWQGEIWNRRKNGEIYPEWLCINVVKDKTDKISHYAGVFTDIAERKRYEEKILRQAYYDTLTGLPNRMLLYDHLKIALSHSQRTKEMLAVLFMDLDEFKEINDTLGHDNGDLLLKYAAERIRGCLRDEDTVARQGGDEFIIILTDVVDVQNITKVAEKILDVISHPFEIEGRKLFVTASIGISVYPSDAPSDTTAADTLIKNADVAMYRAKEQGKNNYQIYSGEMNARVHERMELASSLRKALEQKEFKVHYQPKMDMATGKMVGIEALVRWQHPDRGCIAAGEFILAAEESGVIIPLGQFVLKTACRQNKIWQDRGLARIPVSVNLSTRQFQQKNLVEMVALVLEETALAGHHLELEIPENAIMEDMDSSALTLKRLKELKVLISISDFGTGYSSMGYIKYLPIDRLNIAGSFIKGIAVNPDDRAITSAVIAMACSLDMKVTAQGVETEEQKKLLAGLSCQEIQGYISGAPLPDEEISRILARAIYLEHSH